MPAPRSCATWLTALAATLTLTACSLGGPPSPYARELLYFVDDTIGVDVVRAALTALEADQAALRVSVVADSQGFLDGVALGPDLVVVFNQAESMRPAMLQALLDWVDGGGRAVVFDWYWHPALLDALRVEVISVNHASLSVTDARLAEGVAGPLALTNTGWVTTYATGFVALEGVVAATFDDGSGAIVYANAGRTAAVGVANDALDPDAGRELFRRLLEVMILREAPTGE